MRQWIHGITARPTATDIHSNLGYAYSESSTVAKVEGNAAKAEGDRLKAAGKPDKADECYKKAEECFKKAEEDLGLAERHLTDAVRLKDISPRPHNNLGRVLLRRSQDCEAKAAEAETKGQTEAARRLRIEAKEKLNAAIVEFREAVRLDDTLLEARLNLGEVFISLSDRDKAEGNPAQAEKDLDEAAAQYEAILKLRSKIEQDPQTINNYGQAAYGLARIAMIRNDSDGTVKYLELRWKSSARNPTGSRPLR